MAADKRIAGEESMSGTCFLDGGGAIGAGEPPRDDGAPGHDREELAAIYEHAPVLMCLVDRDRRVLFANRAFSLFTGVEEAELRNGRACGVFGCINAREDVRGCGFGPKCDECSLRLAIADTFATGRPHRDVEYRTTLERDGERREVVLLGATALLGAGDRARLLLCLEDLSERVRMERALGEREAQVRHLLDQLPAGVVVHAPDTRIVFANARATSCLGLSLDQMQGKAAIDPAWSFLREDGTPMPVEEYPVRRVADSCRPLENYVVGIQRPDRPEALWALVNAFPEVDADGRLGQVIVEFVDISARRKAETALRESEERARNLFEHAPVGIFHSVREGRLLAVNPALVRMLGYSSPEELIRETSDMGRQIYADPGKRLEVMDALFRSDGWVHYDEVDWRRKDGRLITVDMTGRRVFDAAGNVAYLEGFIEDITERRRAETALRESEENFRAIANYAASWEAWFSPEGKLLWMNPYSVKLTGYTPEEYLAAEDYLAMVIAEEDIPYVRERFVEALRGGSGDNMEIRSLRRDGSKFWISVSWRPILDADGRSLGFRTSSQDISARKEREEEIRRLNASLESRVASRTAELETALQEMESFSYSVAHDLRAPVRAIDGFASLLGERIGEALDEDARHLLASVKQNSLRMGRLIDDLLDFSRTGRARMSKGLVDMTQIARRVLAEAVPAAERDRWETRLAELAPAQADPGLVEVVLRNLVTNAVKFSARRERPVVEIGCRESDGATWYFVRDNGVGFNPKYAHKLFGVFQRLHGMNEFEGTGIGLALVRKIVERHGGQVRAEGEVDGGATFSFTLGPA